jgi:hypothetical protein
VIGRWTVLNGVLLAVVLLLGVQIARTWMRTVPPMRTPPPEQAETPRRETKKRVVAERTERTDEMVALITNQDLFDASRQAIGSGPLTVAEVPPPTGIELVGIRLLGGDQEALIRDQSQQNAQRRVRAGDEVAGHTVQAINATNVELLNPNGQAVTLWLQLAPSAAKPGVPGRPGVPAPAPRPGGVAPAPPRPAAAVATPQGAGAAAPPMDPRAAERQRLRQQRLERRGGELKPNLPAGIQERLNQLRKGA